MPARIMIDCGPVSGRLQYGASAELNCRWWSRCRYWP